MAGAVVVVVLVYGIEARFERFAGFLPSKVASRYLPQGDVHRARALLLALERCKTQAARRETRVGPSLRMMHARKRDVAVAGKSRMGSIGDGCDETCEIGRLFGLMRRTTPLGPGVLVLTIRYHYCKHCMDITQTHIKYNKPFFSFSILRQLCFELVLEQQRGRGHVAGLRPTTP